MELYIFSNKGEQIEPGFIEPKRINQYMEELSPELATLVDNLKIVGFLNLVIDGNQKD
jgi:hypothetical protein